MGKPTGFLEYERETAKVLPPKVRIANFKEFRTPLNKEKQKLQGARCMACGVPFCQSGMMLGGMASGCPLHNLVPETNDLVYTGNWKQAFLRLSKTHSFPEFTSRVCPALCEAACTCNINGEPVSTKENERAIIETAYENGWVTPQVPEVRTGKSIAVIGSGPSGLAAAQQLNRRGHSVTVFERKDRVGGLLRYGIPNMKLDKAVVDRRIHLMEEEGVKFVTNVNVGKDIKAEELLKQFDRVILACGASNPRDIKVPGRDAKGIYFAVDFLGQVTKALLDSDFAKVPYELAKGKNVLVIGGGDTGNDCVGTSIRLGAKSVIQLEMMPKPPVERTHYYTDAVNRLREIFNDETVISIRSRLHEEGFTIRQEEDVTYAINFKQHIIINLTEENFNLEQLKKQPMKQIERQKNLQSKKTTSRLSDKAKLRDAGGGSHSEKREWEVGQKGNYDNVEDEHSMKIK